MYSLLCSYNKVLEAKEELEQKHLHLLQILDSERQAKWHYVQQTEELAMEVKKLKAEVNSIVSRDMVRLCHMFMYDCVHSLLNVNVVHCT